MPRPPPVTRATSPLRSACCRVSVMAAPFCPFICFLQSRCDFGMVCFPSLQWSALGGLAGTLPLQFNQHAAEDLARGGAWDRGDDFNLANLLVRRHMPCYVGNHFLN